MSLFEYLEFMNKISSIINRSRESININLNYANSHVIRL